MDVVDLDKSAQSARLLAELHSANETLVLCPIDQDANDLCEVVDAPLTLTSGQERVRDGDSAALIVIPAGYGNALATLTKAEIDFYSLTVPTSPDPVRQTLDAVLQRVNSAALTAGVADALLVGIGEQTGATAAIEPWRGAFVRDLYTNVETLMAQRPPAVHYEAVGGASNHENNEEVQGFTQSVPGVGSMYVMFTVLGGMALLQRERQRWTLQRLGVFPLTRGQILGAKILTYFTLGMLQYLVVFAVGLLVGLDFGPNPWLLLLTMAAFVLCCTALTFAIAPALHSEGQANVMTQCRMAYVAAKSLARAGFEVYVCDASPINMTRYSRVVRGFDRTPNPFQDPVGYVECLARIVKQRKIDLLLPGHEDVVSIQAQPHCFPPELMVAAPSHHALSVATDKLHIVRVAARAGVAAPKTIEIFDLDELEDGASQLGFPLIVKTRRGSGGRGVHLVHSVEEMIFEYKRLVAKYQWPRERWPVLQEYIADGQLFGACFLAQEGRIQACFTERYLRCKQDAFGTSVLRERCDWPLLADAAAKIVGELKWTGIGQLDFIARAGMTEPYLLEMNPRWWGALNLAVVNGFDFPLGLITMLLDGQPVSGAFCEVVPPRKSLWIVGELMACRAELMQGKLHGPFSSLWRILFPGHDCAYDDFSWRDPLPLVFEVVHYFERFLRARREAWQGSTAPHPSPPQVGEGTV